MRADIRRSGQQPFFTAPAVVVWLAGIIIAAHVLRLVLPGSVENAAFYWLALWPDRFQLMLEDPFRAGAYGPVSLPVAAFGHTLLHADFMHLLVNAGMLLALGAPVARRQTALRFLAIFFISAAAGALVFLVLRLGGSAPAIGASGGVSGIFAAAFLLMAGPRAGWPELLTGSFLRTSAAFLILNLVMALAGPSLFGAGIAWDAHIGGYVAGALAMATMSHWR